jgi:general secretion pathway protein J
MVARAAAGTRGFTLVEVLVAMVIMAIMAVMAWQGVDGIMRTRNASQQRLEATLRLNTVIAQWDQDLAAIQETGVVSPALACDGATVRLTRRTPDGVQLVAWTLRPGADNTSNWERWAGPSATTNGALNESWLRSQQLQGNEPGILRALSGLTSWQVYFYQGNAWANCQSTGDVATVPAPVAGAASAVPATVAGAVAGAASAAAPVLPAGVRVVLSFAPGSGMNGELTRDTLLKR